MKCSVCFRHCELLEGSHGFCLARGNENGKNVSLNYGYVSSIQLDPIEKKPLKRFHPGSSILSLGSYGCNLHCPFCQNYEISQFELRKACRYLSPERAVNLALSLKKQGNIGIAYTYNEPLIGYEYVRDVAKLAHQKGLLNVLVSNGEFSKETIDEILPYMDAMNIDLKAFTVEGYQKLDGDLKTVEEFIAYVADKTHLEITTLVVPGLNDDPVAFASEVDFIASIDKRIPLHLSRYFPAYKYDEEPTSLAKLKEFEAIAKKKLLYVYLGNV